MVDIFEMLMQIDARFIAFFIVMILIIEVFLLSFPKEVILVFSGLVMGTLVGGILNLIGLFGACWLGYYAGITSRFGVERYRKKKIMQKYENWLNKNGLKALLILRLFPLTPNDILSIATGFSKIKLKPYLIISFITSIPYAFLWAYIGANAIEIIYEYLPGVYNPINWILSIIIVTSLAFVIIKIGTEDQSAE